MYCTYIHYIQYVMSCHVMPRQVTLQYMTLHDVTFILLPTTITTINVCVYINMYTLFTESIHLSSQWPGLWSCLLTCTSDKCGDGAQNQRLALPNLWWANDVYSDEREWSAKTLVNGESKFWSLDISACNQPQFLFWAWERLLKSRPGHCWILCGGFLVRCTLQPLIS